VHTRFLWIAHKVLHIIQIAIRCRLLANIHEGFRVDVVGHVVPHYQLILLLDLTHMLLLIVVAGVRI
jgi:hypothetical protein